MATPPRVAHLNDTLRQRVLGHGRVTFYRRHGERELKPGAQPIAALRQEQAEDAVAAPLPHLVGEDTAIAVPVGAQDLIGRPCARRGDVLGLQPQVDVAEGSGRAARETVDRVPVGGERQAEPGAPPHG